MNRFTREVLAIVKANLFAYMGAACTFAMLFIWYFHSAMTVRTLFGLSHGFRPITFGFISGLLSVAFAVGLVSVYLSELFWIRRLPAERRQDIGARAYLAALRFGMTILFLIATLAFPFIVDFMFRLVAISSLNVPLAVAFASGIFCQFMLQIQVRAKQRHHYSEGVVV